MQNLSCEILVAGGGPAGLSAALAAARNNAKVILCQDRPVLGGNASSEVRMHIVGADCSGRRGEKLSVEARETGIIEEIRLEACVHNPQRSPSIFDVILYDKCRSESNLTLMLNTRVYGAEVVEDKITYAFARRDSTEEEFKIEANIFFDCTGDGGLGVAAGAPFYEGRESKEMFGEDLAQENADNKRLGSSLMFQARKYDKPMPFTPPSWARNFTEEELHLRPHATKAMDNDLGLEYGYWWLEWGGTLDTIRDNEEIRDELLSILLGVWDHVKNDGDHGAENWALEWCGFLPGKRESRRFIGQYTLTQQDVQEAPHFEDAIAYGGWHLDLHPPEGVDAINDPSCIQHPVSTLYDIPLRACVSQKIKNLMFAGRNMSATHVAFASTRVMATTSVIGQGVGTAAALALDKNIQAYEIANNKKLVKRIQQQLLRDGAYLINILNKDSLDIARQAVIHASSEQPKGKAENLISGQTRTVHGKDGVSEDCTNSSTHRWMSNPDKPLPAWIELRWSNPKTVQEIQITFDTGLHRVLTFSLADDYTKKMQWGKPQPETICDYNIQIEHAKKWEQIIEIKNNYQRHRIHEIDGQSVEAIRINVSATNGLNHARICEVRVYE